MFSFLSCFQRKCSQAFFQNCKLIVYQRSSLQKKSLLCSLLNLVSSFQKTSSQAGAQAFFFKRQTCLFTNNKNVFKEIVFLLLLGCIATIIPTVVSQETHLYSCSLALLNLAHEYQQTTESNIFFSSRNSFLLKASSNQNQLFVVDSDFTTE